jgi:lipopolysaccharide/colanic/teichoic acid biosynthesis glycosyltransferase
MFQPAASTIGQTQVSFAELALPPISYVEQPLFSTASWSARIKRTIDVVAAAAVLISLAIPMLIIGLLIRLDSPGPALFRQSRIGFANIGFEMWKFRTMYEHASVPGALRQASRHDIRVTRIGRFLRRYSLDELPQLFNVLRGDMSLVGPRPHALGTCAGGKPFELVTPYYPARHRVLPGMTGLAQIRGLRGETETEEKLLRRVEADLEYIDAWSLWLDVRILTRTVMSMFSMPNAY